MLPDDLFSKSTAPFGAPLTTYTTSLSSYSPATHTAVTATAYDTLFSQLLVTTFGGLTNEEIRTACIAYYPERFI